MSIFRGGCQFWKIWVVVINVALLGGLFLIQPATNVRAGLIVAPEIVTNTYFGGEGNDFIKKVTALPDTSLVIAGSSSLPGFRSGLSYGSLITGTGGFVAKLDATTQNLLWFTSFKADVATVTDVASDSQGNLYLAGVAYSGFSSLNLGSEVCRTVVSGGSDPFVAKIAGNTGELLWGTTFAGDGYPEEVHLAVLPGNLPVVTARDDRQSRLATFSATGGCGLNFTLGDPLNATAYTHINGLATAPNGNFYGVGYHQRGSNLKVPFLVGFNAAGSIIWRGYDSTVVPANLGADSVGRTVTIDTAGNVLAAFTADGGNTTLSRNPLNLNNTISNQLNGAYQNSYGSGGGANASFVARYNSASGSLLDATFFHANLSNGQTNTARTLALTTDSLNRVYLAGAVSCCLPAFPGNISDTSGGHGFLAILNPEMSQLLYATGTGKSGEYTTIVNQGWRVALGGSMSQPNLIPVRSQQTIKKLGNDGILTIFAPPADLALEISSVPQIIAPGVSSQAITVRLKDLLTGQPVPASRDYTLSLASTSPTGKFDVVSGGSFNLTSLTLPVDSSSASFFYKDATPGYPVITVQGSGFATASQPIAVVRLKAEPNQLNFSTSLLGNNLPNAQSMGLVLEGAPNLTTSWTRLNVAYSTGESNWLTFPASGLTGNAFEVVPSRANLSPAGTYTATVTLQEATASTTATVTIAYRVNSPTLSLLGTTPEAGITYPAPFVIGLTDSITGTPVSNTGNPVTISLEVGGNTGSFYASTGSPIAITNVSLPGGANRVTVYYRPAGAGQHQLTFSSSGYSALTSTLTAYNLGGCASFDPTQVNSGGDETAVAADPCQITLREALAVTSTVGLKPGITSLTVHLLSALPAQNNLELVASCNNGKPNLRIDGAQAGIGTIGLQLSGNSRLEGVAIYGFGGAGLTLAGGSELVANCLKIGTPDGLSAQPNGKGLLLNGGRLNLDASDNFRQVQIWQRKPNY